MRLRDVPHRYRFGMRRAIRAHRMMSHGGLGCRHWRGVRMVAGIVVDPSGFYVGFRAECCRRWCGGVRLHPFEVMDWPFRRARR